MSAGYNLGSEAPKPYELSGLVPAASAAVSGADMAKFMIAHLQDGEYEGRRILRPASARLMHDTPLTIINPSLNRNGHRIIGHEGDTRLFHSALILFPDDHVGLFVSLNSLGRDSGAYAVRTGLLDGFADRYFPGPPLQGFMPPATPTADAAVMVGHYDGSRREETSFAAMLNLILQVTVTADEMGHIVASPVTGLGGQPRPFEEVAPFVWREIGGQDRLAAKVVDGKIVMWAEDGDSPYLVYTRTPNWRDATWLIPLLGFSMGADRRDWRRPFDVRLADDTRCNGSYVLRKFSARALDPDSPPLKYRSFPIRGGGLAVEHMGDLHHAKRLAPRVCADVERGVGVKLPNFVLGSTGFSSDGPKPGFLIHSLRAKAEFAPNVENKKITIKT
jgi:hypothetical protein